jgi:hypothetical protein
MVHFLYYGFKKIPSGGDPGLNPFSSYPNRKALFNKKPMSGE